VALTYDADQGATGQLALYIDGALVDEGAAAAKNVDPTVYVGGFGGSNAWRGNLDDVRVYGHALTAEQIAALHSQGENVIVSQETTLGDTWQCRVTPFSASAAGVTEVSNTLTIQEQSLCGNGSIDTGEDCDDSGESATCDADCTFVVCGDGMRNLTAGEECDDGNTVGGDGCSATCTTEGVCGDARERGAAVHCDRGVVRV